MSNEEPIAPNWLRFKGKTFTKQLSVVNNTVKNSTIATVCEEANCPNKTECWSAGTATFMLMGDTCTRGCRFCSVKTALKPAALDPEEPIKLAQALREWEEIDYIVITSVDRDDLDDGGSQHLSRCITTVKEELPKLKIEILIPDFRGSIKQLQHIVDAKPEVIAHNIETVERLTPKVRDRRASYQQSLQVLKNVKLLNPNILTKSSIMVGFSEKKEEVIDTLRDLRHVGVDIITIGQYMRPKLNNLAVREYVTIEQFDEYGQIAKEMGFIYVVSKPLSRSSYKAGEVFLNKYLNKY